ncbi:hypothetical protein LGM69_28035 [Burkholderia multivorans]|nr:hypothetical protein [Burkholderia multivorans]
MHDLVAFVAQMQAQHVGDVGVVLDDQDAFWVVHGDGAARRSAVGLRGGCRIGRRPARMAARGRCRHCAKFSGGKGSQFI